MAFHAVVVSIMELDISIEITLSILWPGLLQECCEPSVFDFCLFYHDYAENFESLRFRAGKVGINPILSDPSQTSKLVGGSLKSITLKGMNSRFTKIHKK